MSSLHNIKSNYNFKLIFQYTGEKRKYNLFKYNKQFQQKLDLNLFDYKRAFFTKDIPEIKNDTLLDYYDFLKRKYLNKYSFQLIKDYFVSFFHEFLKEKKINFELNVSHELALDILLSERLRKIKIIINLNDFKSSFKTEKFNDKNKKSFLHLFQIIFSEKIIPKISQIIIISEDENKKYIKSKFDDLIMQRLIRNIYKFKPAIKTYIIEIYEKIEEYARLNNYNKYELFKSCELIVPIPRNYYMYKPDKNIKFDINLNEPFDINQLNFIKNEKIQNYFVKLNYKDLWSFNDDFSHIKKIELTLEDVCETIDDIKNFERVDDCEIMRGRRGRRGNLRKRKMVEMRENFNSNNLKYIEYINKFYHLYYENEKEYRNLNILKMLTQSEFDDLTIYIDKKPSGEADKFSINKYDNSITFFVDYFSNNENDFLNELKQKESVSLNISRIYSDKNKKEYNIFKFDKDSKVKHFYLSIYFYDILIIPNYSIEFPINFENLITLDLKYTLVVGETSHVSIPLTEKNCDYIFRHLKQLKLDFYYDCGTCIYNSPKDLIPNLSNNLKYCPLLEILDISYEIFKTNLNELHLILKGIKILKNLKVLYLKSKCEENEANYVEKDEFYKFYPEYVNYCPFLNEIKLELTELFKYDLLYEKKVNYNKNDIIINDYIYISTLGEKSSYSTYLCKNKDNKYVVIRKFKKSRINNSLDLFENEKYCLKKFKNNPNVINYLEFLNDEYYEYIVYEYIENKIQKFKSQMIRNKICNFLDNFYKYEIQKDINIIILPILPTNIIIKDNYDIILLGFGYLNLHPDEKEENGKLTNFYCHMNIYLKENFPFVPLSDKYNDYIQDISNYYSSSNLTWEYAMAKIKFNNIKIKKEIKLEISKVGKMILSNKFIFGLQNNSIIIYNKDNFDQITYMSFSDELLNFILIEDNILLALDKFKLCTISFENNELKIADIYEINNSKDKDKEYLNIPEIIFMEKLDIILIGINGINIWKLDKKEKKLIFLKSYDYPNDYSIFKMNIINDITLISVENEKLIFYDLDDEFNLKAKFDYIHNVKNKTISGIKLFKRDEKYCYVLVQNVLMIIKIDDKKNVECLFRACLGRYIINNIFPVRKGLLIIDDCHFCRYLTEIKGNYQIIHNIMFFRNIKVYHIIKDNNQIFIAAYKRDNSNKKFHAYLLINDI